MLQLQQRQMVGKPAIANAPGGQPTLQRLKGHQQEPLEIKLELLCHPKRPVWGKVAILAISKHHKPVVKRAIKHMLACVAPARRGQGGVHIRMRQPALHFAQAHLHQLGMPVGPAALIGYPIGPHIAFFKDMHLNAARACRRNRLSMNGACVAV